MIGKLFQPIIARRQQERKAELYRNLIRHEAKIGGQLFGPVPKDHRREFFCLDRHTWVWHEEWIDTKGKRKTKTTRYDVRPNAVFKAQDGQQYRPVHGEELLNFANAVQMYAQRVDKELYSFV